VPNYGKVESEWVIFPEKAAIENLNYSFQTYEGNTHNPLKAEQLNIEALIKNKIKDKSVFYEMSFEALSDNNEKLEINQVPGSNIYLNEKKVADCGLINVYGQSYSSNDDSALCFTDECLINDKLYHSCLMSGVGAFIGYKRVVTLKIGLHTVSESYHLFLSNLNYQDKIDERFQEMPPSYTNILNGIGIFYARNQGDKKITIKK
jgi:hypothetical protein